MKTFLKENWFKLIIAIVILIIGISIGYYFVVFIPEQARIQREQEQASAQQAQEKEQALELKQQQEIQAQNDLKEQAELDRQEQVRANELARQQAGYKAEQQAKIDKVNLDNCLKDVEQAYETGWANLCEKKANYKTAYNQKLDGDYTECVSKGYDTPEGCKFFLNSKIDDTYDPSCNLDSMEIALFWTNSEASELYYDTNKLKEKHTNDRNLCYQNFN